jgi:hypothetical protein
MLAVHHPLIGNTVPFGWQYSALDLGCSSGSMIKLGHRRRGLRQSSGESAKSRAAAWAWPTA